MAEVAVALTGSSAGSSSTGLSSVEAAARLAGDGANVLPAARLVPLWKRVGTQLRDPLVAVLLVAVVLTITTGDWTDAAVIALVIVVNTAVGVAQEVKADRAITALANVTAPEERVLRDGVQRVIPAADVVVGDVLVLADDDLRTVVAAAEEGRRVYGNIRLFLLYGLSGGTAEIAVMLAGPFLGLPLVLLPAQILWVNLLTHGLPGVALGSEPVDPDAMRRPPRPPAESVLGAGLWARILRVGVVIAAVTLGVAVWGHATGRPWQSMAFFALGATQLAVAVGSRARPGTRANPMLPAAVAGALVLQFAGLYLPPLRDLLGTQPLSTVDIAVCVTLSTLGYAAIRLDRVIHPSKRPAPPVDPPPVPSQGQRGRPLMPASRPHPTGAGRFGTPM